MRLIGFFDEVDDARNFTFRIQRLLSGNHGVLGKVAFHTFSQHLAAARFLETRHHGGKVVTQRIGGGIIQNDIWQHDNERIITDDRLSTQNGVAQAQRLRLTHVHDGYARRADGFHFSQKLALNALFKQRFEFVRRVEVVFNRVFRRVSDEHDLFDTGGHDFVNNVLNHWLIDDRQHLFRNRFGGRQHMHAEAGNRNYCFQINHYQSHLKMVDEL